MEDLIKGIFKDSGEKLKTPQFLGSISGVLLIFRVMFASEFAELMKSLSQDLEKFKFVINIFYIVSIMLFITSILAFITAFIISIMYFIFDAVDNKRGSSNGWLRNSTFTLHRFFIGSKTAVVNVEMWLIVALSYFYIFNEEYLARYKRIIIDYAIHANPIIQFLITIYVITLIVSLLTLVERAMYKYLYFQLDEETEKKLASLRN